jgi:hypothetical protein
MTNGAMDDMKNTMIAVRNRRRKNMPVVAVENSVRSSFLIMNLKNTREINQNSPTTMRKVINLKNTDTSSGTSPGDVSPREVTTMLQTKKKTLRTSSTKKTVAMYVFIVLLGVTVVFMRTSSL